MSIVSLIFNSQNTLDEETKSFLIGLTQPGPRPDFFEKAPTHTLLKFYHQLPSQIEKIYVRWTRLPNFKEALIKGGFIYTYISSLINRIRCTNNRPIESNREFILSLCDIIRLLDAKASLPGFKNSIIHFLRFITALHTGDLDEEEYELIVQVHDIYIRTIDFKHIDSETLTIIVIDLKILYPFCGEAIIPILNYIIVQNGELLGRKLLDLICVRDYDNILLKEVNSKIDAAIDRFDCQEDPIKRILRLSDISTRIEEAPLKYFYIGWMKTMIIENLETINVHDQIHSWVSKVITNLLIASKSSDDNVKIAIAKCLGVFGAIDLCRFIEPPGSDSKGVQKTFHWDTTSEDFRYDILARLGSKGLTCNDTLIQDVVLYTLQEVLKALRIKRKDRPLNLLQHDVADLCRSLMTTNLKVQTVNFNQVDSVPIFSPGISYENWLRFWTEAMIKDLNQNTDLGNFFTALYTLLVSEIPFLEDMLPCILYNYILDSKIPEDRKKVLIIGEITAIINSALPHGVSSFEFSSMVDTQVSVTSVVLNETQLMCAQRIFVLFDNVSMWMNEANADKKITNQCFKQLFGGKEKCSMAYLAYGCKAYTRSLRYLEEYIRRSNDTENFPKNIPVVCSTLFQQIYIGLGEPDGVNGVESIRTSEPELSDRILVHEANNRFQDALSCCEKSVKVNPDSLEDCKKKIRCLMSLHQIDTAYHYASHLHDEKPNWRAKIIPYMATCAWQLSQWDKLGRIVKKSTKEVGRPNMSLNISKLINCLITKDKETFPVLFADATVQAMHPITAAASESSPYERIYPHLVRLQMLNEIKAAASVLHRLDNDSDFSDMESNMLRSFWLNRNDYIQPTMKSLEPILCLQRVLFSSGSKENPSEFAVDIANSWLESAKLSRKTGCMQRAYSCLLEVDSLLCFPKVSRDLGFVASFLTEFAKYHWACGSQVSKEAAIKCLERGLKKHFYKLDEGDLTPAQLKSPIKPASLPVSEQAAYRKLVLLRAKYYEESSLYNSKELIEMYTGLMVEKKRSEKVAFQLAKLYDKISKSTNIELKIDSVNFMVNAIKNYKITLILGYKYVYEALPRLLQIWFDLGTIVCCYESAKQNRGINADRSNEFIKYEKDMKEHFDIANNEINALCRDVPTFVLYTALSQMLSRINHQNKKLAETLQNLVARVLSNHLQQASWYIFGVYFDEGNKSLRQACCSIINLVTNSSKANGVFLNIMKNTTYEFLRLIQEVQPTSDAKEISLKKFSDYTDICAKLRQNSGQILMPCYKYLRAIMPVDRDVADDYNAFSGYITINAISDKITIFSSLAKPKRIKLTGSDGKEYSFLAKGDEDMRRDARVMEYFELMNRLLLKDPETRKRHLKITVYAVVPFGKRLGLIEFVEGLRDIRKILSDEYSARKGFSFSAIKGKHLGKNGTDEYALKSYTSYVNQHLKPPVFWSWFAKKYTHPTLWHSARLNYTRSLALMSIVGYIIGLGDRHLENILFEESTGKVVHVDFNLIFNKGEILETPERVPFRLTHNLIDAMGFTGFEGHFRRTCEEVMRVSRSNLDPITSILRPFVFDPLVGASAETKNTQYGSRRSRGPDPTNKKVDELVNYSKATVKAIVDKMENNNPQAASSIARIEERLKGLYRKFGQETDPVPLSVKGQVNALIEEATDEKNLCRMFFGWAPYL